MKWLTDILRTPSALVVLIVGCLAFLGVLIQSMVNLSIAKLPIEYTQTADAAQRIPTITPTPTLTPTPTPNFSPVTVVVSADKDWQTSKLYIREFEYVVFTSEGQWSPGPDGPLISPDGVIGSPLVSPVNTISGCYHGALIARIGDSSEPFCVGSSRLLQVGEAGYIFLRINDNRTEDNFGYIHLTIQIGTNMTQSALPSVTWTPSPTSTDTPVISSTVTTTLTLDNMPSGEMHFVPDDPVVAGSNRKLEVVMTASEPTKWNAPAFTSDCALTGIPSGFASESTTTYTVSTVAYIPPSAAGKTCTITGTIVTYGTVFASTTFEVKLQFQVMP